MQAHSPAAQRQQWLRAMLGQTDACPSRPLSRPQSYRSLPFRNTRHTEQRGHPAVDAGDAQRPRGEGWRRKRGGTWPWAATTSWAHGPGRTHLEISLQRRRPALGDASCDHGARVNHGPFLGGRGGCAQRGSRTTNPPQRHGTPGRPGRALTFPTASPPATDRITPDTLITRVWNTKEDAPRRTEGHVPSRDPSDTLHREGRPTASRLAAHGAHAGARGRLCSLACSDSRARQPRTRTQKRQPPLSPHVPGSFSGTSAALTRGSPSPDGQGETPPANPRPGRRP